ncbi:MAG TPA: hypothetical protein DD444_22065 [Citreicella sp.]|jgi:hypothetical protein|uniref:hypothetical protein n=1 Tax=Salipiger marinus TaxID=555512 RepID=UPI000E9EA1DF|nr:hypothetical protein [Citreicella sp.]HBT00502.1 hypothetical protein [Citreicella sp.]|tara:strand:+ start:377 stop:817 length:441 start_codon:yes stop_codon:yes gene_type:complete
MIRTAAMALALCAALPAAAAEVTDCDRPEANVRNLARPFASATREFANGDVALVSLLLEEPACCGAHLVVTLPDPEIGYGLCRFVTSDDGLGWSSLDLVGAQARYDPATGLQIALPGQRYEGTGFVPFTLHLTVNQAESRVEAREE